MIHFLREYAARAHSPYTIPATQRMEARDLYGDGTNPDPQEHNWGFVACPVFGHPDFDKVGRCKLDPILKAICFQPLNLRVRSLLSV